MREILILSVASSRQSAKMDQPGGVFVFQGESAGAVSHVLLFDFAVGGAKMPRGRSGHLVAAWQTKASIQFDAYLGLAWRKGDCVYL